MRREQEGHVIRTTMRYSPPPPLQVSFSLTHHHPLSPRIASLHLSYGNNTFLFEIDTTTIRDYQSYHSMTPICLPYPSSMPFSLLNRSKIYCYYLKYTYIQGNKRKRYTGKLHMIDPKNYMVSPVLYFSANRERAVIVVGMFFFYIRIIGTHKDSE